MDKETLSRRKFAQGTIAAGAAIATAGCGGLLGSGGNADLSTGDTVEGEITQDSPRDPIYDDLAESYTFQASDGDTISISQTSEAIDTYIVITDGDGNQVAENDDGGSGFNSQLTMTAPSDGTYTIWAGSFSGEATGSFTLSLSSA